MYHRSWERVLAQDPYEIALAKGLVLWLIFAKRSLNIDELRYALAVSNGMCKFEAENIPTQDVLVSVCCGLVTVDGADGTVRLVREWFSKTGSQMN